MLQDRIAHVETFVAGAWLFVSLTTEKGVTGIGESTYFTHPLAAQAIVQELAQSTYVGADPFQPERLFMGVLKHHCLRDSAAMGALSALDQALWDIKARSLNVPLWQLLGGKVRDRVRAILLIEATTEDEILNKAMTARDEGFTAIKIKPFVGDWTKLSQARLLTRVTETVRAVRNAIGWDMDLAVEVHRNLLPADAVLFAQRIADQLPYFIEDPILPYSVASNVWTAAGMPGTTALAERNTTIWEFREYSDAHGVAILRPDVGLAGGVTQLRKIAAIAESRHQRIVPHNFTSPVITAVHIQLAACTPNWDLQGYVREDRKPWTDVVDRINTVRDGFLEIPETPGVGLSLNRTYLAAASYEPHGAKFGHGAPTGMDGALKHQ